MTHHDDDDFVMGGSTGLGNVGWKDQIALLVVLGGVLLVLYAVTAYQHQKEIDLNPRWYNYLAANHCTVVDRPPESPQKVYACDTGRFIESDLRRKANKEE